MNKLKKGMFITFEGGEGSGKSTQSKMLYQYLISKNIKTLLTREIGGTDSAEAMRDILINQELLPITELLQVMAARYEHVYKKILPALKEGYIVICDRFIDSTACYQGHHQEIGVDLVYQLHNSLISNLMPDITFLISIDPEIALKRINSRHDNNKFDLKNLHFHQKIYEKFQNIAQKFPNRIINIAASHLSIEEVHAHIKKLVSRGS